MFAAHRLGKIDMPFPFLWILKQINNALHLRAEVIPVLHIAPEHVYAHLHRLVDGATEFVAKPLKRLPFLSSNLAGNGLAILAVEHIDLLCLCEQLIGHLI